MAQTPGQQRAADAVAGELARRGWTNTDLRDATAELNADDPPVDLGTIGDFLAYRRWPKTRTLGKFERVFDWEPGSLRRLALSGQPVTLLPNETNTVPAEPQDGLGGWLTRVSRDLTAEERERLWGKYGHLFEVMVQEAISEAHNSDPNTPRGTT